MNNINDNIQEKIADRKLNILKGFVEYDDLIEKAVYADTPENRKLGRVGKNYGRNSKSEANKIKNDSDDLKEKTDRADKNERTTSDMLSQLSYSEKKSIKDKFTGGSKQFNDEVKKVFEKKFFDKKEENKKEGDESTNTSVSDYAASTSTEDLKKYIKKNPKGEHVEEAKAELNKRK